MKWETSGILKNKLLNEGIDHESYLSGPIIFIRILLLILLYSEIAL